MGVKGGYIGHVHIWGFTYVLFVAFHVVCKRGAAQLVSPEEAEVTGDFSGYGGGQTLEEPLRTLVLHNGLDHGPHRTSRRTQWIQEKKSSTLNLLCLRHKTTE